MKITKDNYLEVLKDLNACESQMKKLKTYSNEKIKSLIDKLNDKKITLIDLSMFYNFHWLKSKLKDELPFNKLTRSNDKNDFWEEYTYDKDGNVLTYNNSNGHLEECTYNKDGNMLSYKNSDGTLKEWTYDDENYNR